ncbi:helix-turn-helix domain-containing protein [Geothrix sp. 21YS21S-2]|uniref:helix-turn-helix domain-containing protein n=1 Tax=Geothrix sp. 21YS21S-2 TaxID=3068893 RepID=UPI0027B9CAD9|nr:helix-turn-helix transcriptional regulator [Geothrix sp. 21YS21S-2]
MVKTLGDRIRELREGKDLSLRELSKKVGEASAAFLSDVELGRRFPSEKTLVNLADALETTIKDLQQYDSRPPVEEMRRIANAHPALGVAFRKLIELPVEEQLKILKNQLPPSDPGERKK